ncbi:hypothetical protein GCM10027037_35260 [Mucilaginibacter koreensis]
MQNKKVVIVGAAGFVGIELVSQLQNIEGYDLYAYTRDNGNFLLQGKNIKNLTDKEISENGPFDIVVNLAYPTVSMAYEFPAVNQKILGTLKKLVSANTRLIHVSTQAVFGFSMDRPVVADFIANRRDQAYIEAKLSMENFIKRDFPNHNVSIVRLGNVWGPGAGTWTGSVANRLTFGQFVAVENIDGYANITDVKNVVSYLIHLIKTDKLSGFNMFHLSEFSNKKWSEIIRLMAEALNVEPVYSTVKPVDTASAVQDFKKVVKKPAIGELYRGLIRERFTGSYLRSLIRFMGVGRYQKAKKIETRTLPAIHTLGMEDGVYLNVVSSPVEFKSVVMSDWTPQLNFEQSWQLVKDWMTEVGYLTGTEA